MTANPNEIIYWLQDVREHLRVSQRRKSLRQAGQGVDYTQDRDSIRGIVSRLHPSQMKLRLTEIIQQTPSTKTFRFERTDGPLPPFRPGQYVNVFVDVDGVLTSRPYSIASPPGSETLELTVKDKPGGFVAPFLLNELRVSDVLDTTGPEGNFYYEPLIDGDKLVFLAGGSGITPFMSIIMETLEGGGEKRALQIQLLYGCRMQDDVIYGEELAELAAKHNNFDYSLVISEASPEYGGLTGLLNAELIHQLVDDVQGKTFYICGPNVMYDFCLAALYQLGVPRHKIKRELYGPPDDITCEPGWPEGISPDRIYTVKIAGQKTVRAPAGEPLMNTLERYGIVIPAICRAGDCSACRIRLLSGKVFMPAQTGIRESDREYGYIHACVSYPLEDLQIRI